MVNRGPRKVKNQNTGRKYSVIDNKKIKIILALYHTTGKTKTKITKNTGLTSMDFSELSGILNQLIESGIVEQKQSQESDNTIFCNTEKGDEMATNLKNFCEDNPEWVKLLESLNEYEKPLSSATNQF
tara:strand:- start:75 stop:458 length:384 start_codon:yes stop_codon:yes gene_type:complete